MASRALSAAFATEARTTITLGAAVLALGLALGFAVPGSSSLAGPWRFWSNLIGWTYFAAWSVSFWPQVIMIARRGRVSGLSFDFLALNLLGFSAYSAFNVALYFSPAVRAQYAVKFPGKTPTVALNDVLFGLHAVFATLVSIAQCALMPRDASQGITRGGAAWLAVLVTAIVSYALAVATAPDGAAAAAGAGERSWLAFFTFISYVKLAISLTKYAPQVWLNAKNKSTAGWSIHNVLLDFAGGLLSVAQLMLDCLVTGDWSGAIGDPVKFGLGFTSMVFDVVFMSQHYIFFPSSATSDEGGEYAPIKTVDGSGF